MSLAPSCARRRSGSRDVTALLGPENRDGTRTPSHTQLGRAACLCSIVLFDSIFTLPSEAVTAYLHFTDEENETGGHREHAKSLGASTWHACPGKHLPGPLQSDRGGPGSPTPKPPSDFHRRTQGPGAPHAACPHVERGPGSGLSGLAGLVTGQSILRLTSLSCHLSGSNTQIKQEATLIPAEL